MYFVVIIVINFDIIIIIINIITIRFISFIIGFAGGFNLSVPTHPVLDLLTADYRSVPSFRHDVLFCKPSLNLMVGWYGT